jgi:hypothetical protein
MEQRCSVEKCDRKHYARGLCEMHSKRWKLTGSVRADVPIREVSGDGCVSHGYRQVPVPPDERWLTRGETYVLEHRLVMPNLLRTTSSDNKNT